MRLFSPLFSAALGLTVLACAALPASAAFPADTESIEQLAPEPMDGASLEFAVILDNVTAIADVDVGAIVAEPRPSHALPAALVPLRPLAAVAAIRSDTSRSPP